MTAGWEAAVVVAGLVALLSAGLCFVALRRMERRFARMERALRDQVEMLGDAVRMIEARVVESLSPMVGGAATADQSSAGEDAEFLLGESVDAAIAPEIQAAIAAAAVVAAGPKARVRSMQLLNGPEDASAWSRQGRVLVQSSHNARPAR